MAGSQFKNHLKLYQFLIPAWLVFLSVNFCFRILLLGKYSEILNHDTWLVLFYGMRMDTIVFCAFALFFALFFALNLRLLLRLSISLFLIAAVWFEISAIFFFEQFSSRPNYLFIEHSKNAVEIFLTIWGLYPVSVVLVFVALVFSGLRLFALTARLQIGGTFKQRFVILPLIVLILAAGMRSSFDDSTPNQSFYTFSHDNSKNEIANNTIFSILYAWHWSENEYFGNYGSLTDAEAVQRLNSLNGFKADAQLLRMQTALSAGKKNVILIMLESFGHEHVGYLGGTPTTPNLDRLAAQGLAFTNMYATGNRTSWGVSTVLTATYPVPGQAYVKALKSQQNFYTIARSFKQHGYHNMFLYSGDADFDNMKAFMLSNGFDQVQGKEAFDLLQHKYTWGYADEDLYQKAEELIKAQTAPFFLSLLTLSSHEPFDYPEGKVELYAEAPVQGFANSIKYADFALGKFIASLKKQGLMKNTVIGLIADHANSAYGTQDVPVDRYRIAAVILDEDLKPAQTYRHVASQVDFGPTLLDLAGLDVTLPGVGASVLQHQRDSALLLYHYNYAYLTSEDLVIYKDGQAAKSYSPDYKPKPADAEVVSDGLANILVPHWLYESGLYRLP